jgi:hypothetical protein
MPPYSAGSPVIANSTRTDYTLDTNYGAVLYAPCAPGRLTLTANTPVPVADPTPSNTVYYSTTKFKGGRLGVYTTTTGWSIIVLASDLSLDVTSTGTNGTPIDMFIDTTGSNPVLFGLSWTSANIRATTLVQQDAVWGYFPIAGTFSRYIGSVCKESSTSKVRDDATFRYVWNLKNQVLRTMIGFNPAATTWTYTTATWRQADASNMNQVNYLIGIILEAGHIFITVNATGSNSSNIAVFGVGIGMNSTNMNSAVTAATISTKPGTLGAVPNLLISATLTTLPQIMGTNYSAWLEYSTAANTTTWTGTDGVFHSSISAYVQC